MSRYARKGTEKGRKKHRRKAIERKPDENKEWQRGTRKEKEGTLEGHEGTLEGHEGTKKPWKELWKAVRMPAERKEA